MNQNQEEEFNVTLGKRLCALRQNNQMTLEYLGAILGVTHQQVHKYETGETTMGPKRISICAKLFNVPVGYFYGEEDDKNQRLFKYNQDMDVMKEIQKLPYDVRRGFYHLSVKINDALNDEDQKIDEMVNDNKKN